MTTRAVIATMSTAMKIAAGRRHWDGMGIVRNRATTIRPTARPSSARSTTMVARTVQNR
jgi:hypothetical protein